MEVKEFVKTILKEVTEAVDESKSEKANFYFMQSSSEGIDFDLAVVSKKEGKGKVGAEVLGIGGKTEVIDGVNYVSIDAISFEGVKDKAVKASIVENILITIVVARRWNQLR